MKPSTKRVLAIATALVLVVSLSLLNRLADQPSQKEQSSPTISLHHATQRLLAEAREQTSVTAELIELAQQRRRLISQLMRDKPQLALDSAYSFAEYHSLPHELQALAETPFTRSADFSITAVCDTDPATPEFQYSLRFPDSSRSDLQSHAANRLPISKENAPLQGILLDGTSVIRSEIFQVLEPADALWATQTLPLANSDPAADFLTQQPIEGQPVYAVSGGYLFHFANLENLASLETQLAPLDARPGLALGSPALLATLRKETSPFSPNEFFAEQAAAAAPPTDEVRDYLIIRVEFSDKLGTPFTKAAIETMVQNSVIPALAEYSYNKTTVAVTATDKVYTLGASSLYNDTNKLHDDAVAAYVADGNPSPNAQYEHVSVSFPHLGFSWAGLATLGGRSQWLQGNVNADTVLHELGHNYGLSHASYWQHDATNQASTNPVNPTGASEEYGDIYDTMGDGGNAKGHFHMGAKQFLGWIPNTDWENLTTGIDSATYRIYAFDNAAATGLRALRINKAGSSERYWVGYRKKYQGVPRLADGAYLVWQRPGSSNNRSWLIDTTPGSSDGKADAGLSLGSTYSDSTAGVHITPIATGQNAQGSYLDVTVNIGSFAGNQAPSGTLTAAASGEARTPVSFSFSGSDPDNDALAYHWDFGDGTVEISSAAVEHSFPVGGNYTLTLTVSDMKGGTFIQQAQVTVSDPITEVTTRSSPTSNHLNAIAANDTVVVAGGARGTFIRSSDGENWTLESLTSGAINVRIADITWTGSEFIAVGSDFDSNLSQWEGVSYSSPDGDVWTPLHRSSDSPGSWGFTSVAGESTTNTLVLVRNDSKLEIRDANGAWSTVDIGRVPSAWQNVLDPATVVWTGSSYALGAYDQSSPAPSSRLVLYRSPDALIWTDSVIDSGLLDWYGLDKLAFLNGQLLGSGFKSRMAYSEDHGQTWASNGQGDIYRADSYSYGNGIYSAFGVIDVPGVQGQPESSADDTPQEFLSTDGRNWKPAGTPNATYHDRVFFADTFISVGDNGLIHQSAIFNATAQSPFLSWILGFTTDESKQGAIANPDYDWAPNFLEFALGSDPVDSASIPDAPTLRFTEDGHITVSISRFASTDVILSLEFSTDLVNWSPLPTTATVDTELLLELTTTLPYENLDALFIQIKAAL